jgi:hypothetical protein
MIEISRKKCYAINGKCKKMSLLHNYELQDSDWEDYILKSLFL